MFPFLFSWFFISTKHGKVKLKYFIYVNIEQKLFTIQATSSKTIVSICWVYFGLLVTKCHR